ncbi:ATP-binding cassette domain-containing protein [Actinokineospora spheciospongiae]|uniref:ATP-binding cassette domain-containing protein n=1 Tax=Actinokineospora spheciospongiae TaxID=909613 RepID=UPI00227924A2|nr:ATP-binding cassette domain-containing protein [Actinokineospora spheciospongiae]
MIIEVSGLRKDFTVTTKVGRLRRERTVVSAVDGVDLVVGRGELIGYIGPNGAGKSTTLKVLTGVLTPSAGRVRVCGLDPVADRTTLARRIGVVFGQRSQLWWDLPLGSPSSCCATSTGCPPPSTPPGCAPARTCSTSTGSPAPRSASSPSGSGCAGS